MQKLFDIEEIVTATGGVLLSSPFPTATGFGTDTRKDLSGQLFLALKGPSFDAHDYLDKAVDKGARVLLVHEKPSNEILTQASVIQVQDTLKALQDLGRYYRRKHKLTLIGITGSNGKTSTKEFTAQILEAHKNLHYSKGSFNNHWGVPMTLLDIQDEHELVISEMGMNHAGEIKELVQIAEPDIVVCTTVGQAHLEFFKNMEELAQAKAEIYVHSKPDAIGVFNLDNPHTLLMYQAWVEERGEAKALSFSQEAIKNPTVCLKIDEMQKDALILSGRIQDSEMSGIRVPVFGEQNIFNLMAAAAICLAAGLSPGQIWSRLPHCATAWGRNQAVKLKSGADLIFDGYNANPDSMTALLKNAALIQGHSARIAVLGEMLEMGEQSARVHEELGMLAAQCGLDWVWFIGPHAEDFKRGLERAGFSKNFVLSEAYEQSVASELRNMLQGSEIILVKGSRGIKLEQVVQALDPIDFRAKA